MCKLRISIYVLLLFLFCSLHAHAFAMVSRSDGTPPTAPEATLQDFLRWTPPVTPHVVTLGRTTKLTALAQAETLRAQGVFPVSVIDDREGNKNRCFEIVRQAAALKSVAVVDCTQWAGRRENVLEGLVLGAYRLAVDLKNEAYAEEFSKLLDMINNSEPPAILDYHKSFEELDN